MSEEKPVPKPRPKRKTDSDSGLVLFTPDPLGDEIEVERETTEGLLFPSFFYLTNNTAITALVVSRDIEFITLALPYKVEMVRDTDGLYTRLRLYYPKLYINLYHAAIMYEAKPLNSAEYRYVNTLLCDRKRDYQRVLHDYAIDLESQTEYLKQRKIELEQRSSSNTK